MNYDLVLGNDELDRIGVIIDYLNGQIQIGNEIIKFKYNTLNNGTENDGKVNEVEKYICNMNNNDIIGKEICNKNNIDENKNENMKKDYNMKNILNMHIMHGILEVNCKEERRGDIVELLKKYENLITDGNQITNKYVHKLEMKPINNFKSKTYPIPYKYRKEVDKEIQDMLNNKIIEKSKSQFISPIVVVKKSNGEIRLCLDARNINRFTKPQYESPMNTEAIFGRITHSNYFSKIDLKHSFWLIPLHVQSREYTAFSINGVVFHFRVVPYGLQSSCAALVRALHAILDKYEDFIVHYVDDILVYSHDEDSHLQHINILLRELYEAGLKINLKKCHFFQKEVTFLGFKINREGVQMDEERVKTIQEYKRPINLKTLRGFLGLINYFRKLVPNISEKEIPLIKLLKKGNKWNWGDDQEEAFVTLKKEFMQNLKIYHPQYDKEFILRTDSSIYKLAGVLLQVQNGIEVPICFVSRVTKEYERKMGVTELEFASIIYCVSKLRFYLLGGKFIIETDHSSLINIMNNRFLNHRIHRGALLLQEYDFEVRYIKGKENVVADALTRDESFGTRGKKKLQIGVNIFKNKEGVFSENEVKTDQSKISIEKFRKCIKLGDIYIKKMGEDELYYISQELTIKIMKILHEKYGHGGVRKTWMIFRENYYSETDLSIAKRVISTCKICQIYKYKNFINQNVPRNIKVERKLQTICIDFIGELIVTRRENRYIFIVIDFFSKYVKLFATKTTKVQDIIKNLNAYYNEVGKPETCILDNATYFNNNKLKKFCNEKEINLKYTSIRHPQANPAERYVQEVLKFLRIVANQDHREWDSKLVEIEKYINNTPNTVTNVAPIYIMFQKHPERDWINTQNKNYEEILNKVNVRIKRNGIRYLKRCEKKKLHKNVNFKQGDLVLVRSHRVSDYKNNICRKFLPPLEGPYVILNENGMNSYILGDIHDKSHRGIFNINDLYKFYEGVDLNIESNNQSVNE